ncbi:efflux transporter outer membrane subunit [Steroidobacter agaridevorans]|uniref:efflux transporter outer membrane subunit n=1 Tax=Steroidobacter agaridevorans TaxID=2695856 RepID=UPI00132651D9|nr:efflux transporter outer membrane subunit [Steroidobacter agaridevorans]GFE85649.1 outer membrane efflux protein [Steroidobacter agaridevorans]
MARLSNTAPASLVIAGMFLGACSLAPRHVRPELPTPERYADSYVDDPAAGTRAIALGWRDFFADPRLEALIATALKNNRDLTIAVAQIEEARGAYRIQRSELLPTIAVSAEGTRNGAGPETAGVSGLGPIGTSETFERYFLGAGIASFELDFWGRVRNLSRAARADYLATVEAARAFQLSLIRDVASAYFASLEARERLELAQATVDSRREGLRIAKKRLDAGVTSALDFRQAETLLTQAETELAALHFSKAQSENLLATLIGSAATVELPEPLPLAEQARLETLAAGVPSDLLASRPDIVAAEHRLRGARANIGAARAAFFPSITLTGSYGFASTQLDELVGNDRRTWSYGPSISLPIFDFGARRGNLTVAEARENIAVADYERTIQTSFQEVSDALAGRKFLAEQVSAQERATRAQRQLAELARRRYNEGVVAYIEVLDAERNLFSAEQALLQVRRAEVSNLVTLYIALGGGQIEAR